MAATLPRRGADAAVTPLRLWASALACMVEGKLRAKKRKKEQGQARAKLLSI